MSVWMDPGAHTPALGNFCKTCLLVFCFCLLLCMCFVLLDALLMNLFIKSTLNIDLTLQTEFLKYIPHLSLCTYTGAKPSSLTAIGEHFIGRMSIVSAKPFHTTVKAKCAFFMVPHQDIQCGIAHSCSCHTSIPPPHLKTNEGLKQRRLEQKTMMGEEQEDDSSSLKSTGYVFLLSRGLESTTPTQ